MTGCTRAFCLVVGTAVAIVAAQPAVAATVRRHIDCFVLGVGVGGLLGGSPQMFATVTNKSSATIPGGTTYSLTVEGRHLTHYSASPLGPGDYFQVQIGFTNHSGACDATYPDNQFAVNAQKLNKNLMKASP